MVGLGGGGNLGIYCVVCKQRARHRFGLEERMGLLQEVVGQYTQLDTFGDVMKGICPFPSHKERTPSFVVHLGRQGFHCFGCRKGGNLNTFLEFIKKES